MGLFDTVKLKANALAADAERAGKVTAAQARTVVLQNEIRKAERELGHSAFSLIESGEIGHPDLEATAARLREARQAPHDKEAEIARLRQGAAGPAPERAETGAPEPAAKRRAPAAKKPAAAKKPTSRKKKTVTEGPAGGELIAEARSQAHAHSHLTG